MSGIDVDAPKEVLAQVRHDEDLDTNDVSNHSELA